MGKDIPSAIDHAGITEGIAKETKECLVANICHFKDDDTALGKRLYNGLCAVQNGMDCLLAESEPIRNVCVSYDLSPEEPGNGWRSTIQVVDAAVLRIREILNQISKGRGTLLFNARHFAKEMEAWSEALSSLTILFDFYNTVMLPQCVDGELLPVTEASTEEIFRFTNTVSQPAFHGRCFSFHYSEAMQKVFKALSITLCTFSEAYYSDGGFMQRTSQSLVTGSKYLLNCDFRAKRLVDILQYCSVDFIKSYWALFNMEVITKWNTYTGYNIAVEEQIVVPCEDQEIPSEDGGLLVIKAPHSHVPSNPIHCYLLSSNIREGMQNYISKNAKLLPKSDFIFFHCHGGGYISQSTKAQLVFLREWCVKMDIPIFSVDYTLSPYAPFPRALEEVITTYVWMLNNFSRLGTTGKKIICTGDSAGGNLVTALTIKCLEMGIRPPDSMFLIYTPHHIKITPSASRLMQFMDPLLPLQFAFRCSKAYAGISSDSYDSQNRSDNKGSPFTNGYTNAVHKAANLTDNETKSVGSNMQGDKESFAEVNDCEPQSTSDTMTKFLPTSKDNPCNGCVNGLPANRVNMSSSNDEAERSRKYVSQFLSKYVFDTRVDKEGFSIDILRKWRDLEQEDGVRLVKPLSCHDRKTNDTAKNSSFEAIPSSLDGSNSDSSKTQARTPKTKTMDPNCGKIELGTSLLKGGEGSYTVKEQFAGINIDPDYLIHTYFAPREIFVKFPPTYFLTADYDFTLDDNVMMAKRLRSLGVKTKLKVLPKLPHGFLNLCHISKEAHNGNKEAIGLLKELIELNDTAC